MLILLKDLHRNAARKLAILAAGGIAAKFGFWKGLRSFHRMFGMMWFVRGALLNPGEYIERTEHIQGRW